MSTGHIAELVGKSSRNSADLDQAVRQGLPSAAVIDYLVENLGYTAQDFNWISSPVYDESDKTLRAARLTSLARDVFGNAQKAERWMHKPRKALKGLCAMEAMQTETGGRLVEELLRQLESGYFA